MNQRNNKKFCKKIIFLYFLSLAFINFFELKANQFNEDKKMLEQDIDLVEKITQKKSSDTLNWEIIDNQRFNKNKIEWEIIDDDDVFIIDNSLKDEDTLEIKIKKIEADQFNFNFFNLGNAVPTAFVAKEGDLRAYVKQVFPLSKGTLESGTANQNYSTRFDYGLTKKTMLSGFFSFSDDPLYKRIIGVEKQPANRWLNYGGSLKWKLFDNQKYIISLDKSFEIWNVKSGGCNGIGCTTESSNIFDKSLKEFQKNNFIGSFALPISFKFKENNFVSFVPKISMLPSRQKRNDIEGEFYGFNYGIGFGFSRNWYPKFKTFSSIYIPIGESKNSFNEEIKFEKNIIYSTGFNYAFDSKTAFEAYISNSFGGTPATGILTIPSDNNLIIGSKFIYTPTAIEISGPSLEETQTRNLEGLSVTTASLIKAENKVFDINFDNNGSYWIKGVVGLSKAFNFEITTGQNQLSTNNLFEDSYIKNNVQNLRIGGKAIIISKEDGNLFDSGVRLTFGRSIGETWPGYMFLENVNTFNIRKNSYLSISPKFAWTGEGSLSAIGVNLTWIFNNPFSLITESNISNGKSSSNYTVALRYSSSNSKYFDIYTTNALNFTDLGELINSNNQSFGIKIGLRI